MNVTVRYSMPEPVNNEYSMLRLQQSLEQSLKKPFVFACAPTGSGKTTALSGFARALEARPAFHVVWLGMMHDKSVQCELDIVGELVRAFAHANDQEVATAACGIDNNEVRGLERWGDLVRALSRVQGRTVLFIDGVENVLNSDALAQFNHIVLSVPDGLNIVAAGRLNPGIILFQLRANEEVCELYEEDFSLNKDEIVSYFRKRGMALSRSDAAFLSARTGGWMLGLRMISTIVSNSSLPHVALKSQKALQPWVSEYLTNGAAAQNDWDTRHFALMMSLFEEFDERLAELFADSMEIARYLNGLLAQGLVMKEEVYVSDGVQVRYRFRPLFLEEIRRRAHVMLSNEEVHEVSSAAVDWYESRGLYSQAITTAISVKEYDMALNILAHNLYSILSKDFGGTLSRWLEEIPYQDNEYEYMYCLLNAWTAFAGGKTRRAQTWLRKAEGAKSAVDDDVLQGSENILGTIQVGVLVFSGEYQKAVAAGSKLLERLGGRQLFLRCTVMHNMGEALVRLGKFEIAYEYFARARIDSELAGRRVIDMLCVCEMAHIQYLQGHLDASSNILLRSLSVCSEDELEQSWAAGLLHVGMARVHLGWGDTPKASEWIERALKRLRPTVNRDGYLEARAVLARIKMTEGLYDDAFDILLENYELLQLDHVPRGIDLLCLETLAECLVEMGNAGKAISVIEEMKDGFGAEDVQSHLYSLYCQARVGMAEGEDTDKTIALFMQAEREAMESGLLLLAIDCKASAACAYRMTGEKDTAYKLMVEALLAAADESLLSIFEKRIPYLNSLIYGLVHDSNVNRVQHGDRGKVREFAQSIMEKRGNFPLEQAVPSEAGAAAAVVALSPREKEVYELLKLGHTRKQIAEELHIQINTVRTHARNIYQKLGIHERSML